MAEDEFRRFVKKQLHPQTQPYWDSRGKYRQIRHLKSLFSDKPDPSQHDDRLARKGITRKPTTLEEIRRKEDNDLKQMMTKKKRMEAHELQEMARENADMLFKVIMEIASNDEAPAAVRLQAANMGLDRAFGKAATTNINVNADIDTKLADLDDAALKRRLIQNIARIEANTADDGKTIEGEARPINIREYN